MSSIVKWQSNYKLWFQKNTHTSPKDGSLVWTLLPPGISSLVSYFLPLGVSSSSNATLNYCNDLRNIDNKALYTTAKR